MTETWQKSVISFPTLGTSYSFYFVMHETSQKLCTIQYDYLPKSEYILFYSHQAKNKIQILFNL